MYIEKNNQEMLNFKRIRKGTKKHDLTIVVG